MPPCLERRVAQDGADELLTERMNDFVNVHRHDDDVTVTDENPFGAPRNRSLEHSANRFKVEIPIFDGSLKPQEFIDWLSQADEILDFKNVPDDRRVPLVAIRLRGRAKAWWQQLKEIRARSFKSKISSWEKFKKHARAAFLPYKLYQRFQNLYQAEKQLSRSKPGGFHQHLPSAGATGSSAPPRCITSRCSNKEEISTSTPKLIYTVTLCKDEHPECNSRLPAVLNALEKMHLTPKFRGSEIIQLQNYKTATLEDVAAVHSALEKAMETVSEESVDGSGDTTFKESLVAAGAGLSLVDYAVTSAKITKNPPIGFALTCPPGHHAVPDGPMGPCFAGNVAIAARYVQRVHGLKRVLIIDFDAHHGNATNDVFYDDPDVFVLSTYQDGIFPGTGKIDDIGRENGVGATLNLPLPALSGDIAMLIVYNGVIVPCAQKFKPDIILVSAGYNGHVQDPGSKLQCRTMTYYLLASGIKKLATDLCGGRCVLFLEGGYNLESLSDSLAESFRAFIGEPSNSTELDIRHFCIMEPLHRLKQAIQKIKQLHNL